MCLGLCMTPFSSTNTMIRSSPACSRKKKLSSWLENREGVEVCVCVFGSMYDSFFFY